MSAGDAIFVALCAVMLSLCTIEFADWIPGLVEMEDSLALRRGISDKYTVDAWPLFAAVSVAYILLITLGISYMDKHGKPITIAKRVLPAWSLVAWVFSFFATVRLGSAMMSHLRMSQEETGGETIIDGISNAAKHYCMNVDIILEALPGFREKLTWLTLFVYSKPFEFIDTVFLVLNRKPVSRLHYVHHLVTMWFSWMNLVLFASPGLIFALINAFVHTVMYCWYFLASLKLKPSGFAIIVTVLQNIQMLIGVFIPAYYYKIRNECHIPTVYWVITMAMYTLYVFLFGNFFCQKYVCKKNRSSKGRKARDEAASETATAAVG